MESKMTAPTVRNAQGGLDAPSKSEYVEIGNQVKEGADELIKLAAIVTQGDAVLAAAMLFQDAAAIASADGMPKQQFFEGVKIAWDNCEELRR